MTSKKPNEIEIDIMDICCICIKKNCPLKDFVKKNHWVSLIIKNCEIVELENCNGNK